MALDTNYGKIENQEEVSKMSLRVTIYESLSAEVIRYESPSSEVTEYGSLMSGITIYCYDKAVSASRGECGLCYDKVVSTSRSERGLRAASTRLSVKLRVSECSRGLGHARGLGSENTS